MKILKSETFKGNLIAFSVSSLCLLVIYYLRRYFLDMSPIKQMKFVLSDTSMFKFLLFGLFITTFVMALFCGGSFVLAHDWSESVIGLCFLVIAHLL